MQTSNAWGLGMRGITSLLTRYVQVIAVLSPAYTLHTVTVLMMKLFVVLQGI